MTRRKPPDHRHRQDTTDILTLLGATLTNPQAAAIFETLKHASEEGYPTRASTSPPSPGNAVDETGQPVVSPTATERPTLTPDPTAAQARRLLDLYHDIGRMALELRYGLAGFDPSRSVAVCTRCGYPLERGRKRCQRVDDDGAPCGASEDSWPPCKTCETPTPPAEMRRGRCNACRQAAGRSATVRQERGTNTIKATDLALGGSILESGAYVAD